MRRFVRTQNRVIICGIGAVMAAYFALTWSDPVGGQRSVAYEVVSLSLMTVGVGIAIRGSRIGLLVGDGFVIVRNVLRTRRFPAASVDHLEFGHVWTTLGPAAILRLRDGKSVSVTALLPPNRAFRSLDWTTDLLSRADEAIAEEALEK